MSARGERDAQAQQASLLTMAALRADDAVSRHSRARLRRERKTNPLLTETSPDSADERAGKRPLLDRLSSLGQRGRQDEAEAGADGNADFYPPHSDELADDAYETRRPGLGRIVGLTLAGALVGASLAYAMPAAYVATAELLVDPARDARAAQLSPDAAFALVDNQIRVLRSGTMLGAVADRLNLASDAEFLGAGQGWFGNATELVSGEPMRVDGRQKAIDMLGKALAVDRVDGSSAITVSARTADAAKSALLVNTLSELYVAGSGAGAVDTDTASARLQSLRAELEAAERAVETYKTTNDLVDAQGRLISDEQILALGERLNAAKARTLDLNARAASTREANVDSIVTGSLPEQFASPSVNDLRERHAAAKQHMDRIATKLGPRHPERLAAEAELDGAREQLAAELRRVAGAVQTELKRAVQQEQELASELARMKVRQGQVGEELIQLRELERTAELKRSAYEDALRGSQVAATGITADARILSRAEAPLAPSGRPLASFSLAGALGGLLLGLGLSRRRGDAAHDRDDEDRFVEADEPVDAAGHSESSSKAERSGRQPRKENDTMYPYPYQAGYQPAAADPHAHQQPVAAHGQQQPAGWQGMPQPAPMPQPAMPMPGMGYNPYQAPAWQAMPPMQPAPPPVDPWAHLRGGYPQPQPYAQAPFSPPPYAPPPVFILQTAPAPQPVVQSAPPQARPAEPDRRADWRDERHYRREADHADQDRYVDEHTNAAIEEIRQSLREFRDAIEDLADERFRDRDRYERYGT